MLPLDRDAAVDQLIAMTQQPSRWRVMFYYGTEHYSSDHDHDGAIGAIIAAFDALAANHPELAPRINDFHVRCDPVHRDDPEITGMPS